jgi:hypothetical protein
MKVYIPITPNDSNEYYLGYDEDHNGEWDDFFICPNCHYTYLSYGYVACPVCFAEIIWINLSESN